jgi:hypothetical protein
LEGNLAAGNWLFGIGVIALGPSLPHPTYGDVKVQATIDRCASVNDAWYNLLVYGGLGTDDSKVRVRVFDSVFRGASRANIAAMGGITYTDPERGGANNNKVKLTLEDNVVTDGAVGITAQGGVVLPPYVDPYDRKSSNNEVKVNISDTTFQRNTTDITAYGAASIVGEPIGDYNEVRVVIEDDDAQDLECVVLPCFPEDEFPVCTNKARIVEDDD